MPGTPSTMIHTLCDRTTVSHHSNYKLKMIKYKGEQLPTPWLVIICEMMVLLHVHSSHHKDRVGEVQIRFLQKRKGKILTSGTYKIVIMDWKRKRGKRLQS